MSLSWWNGRTMDAEEVRIPPDDPGFLFGDGLFETLRVDAGRPLDLAAHLDRLFAGLERIGIEIPEDRETVGRAVLEIAETAPRPVARLRITVSRGTRLITASPYEPPGEDLYRKGVTVVLMPEFRIDSQSSLRGLKSLSYQNNRLALREAERYGAWEALLLNERLRLAEGSRSNIALILPEGIFTPPESDGCRPGTVRRRLLESRAIHQRRLSPNDLTKMSGLLLMNSLIGVLPVSRIARREMLVGPEAARLREIWMDVAGRPLPIAAPPGSGARRPPRA
jgi:branched-chain amino acid aminotransferase